MQHSVEVVSSSDISSNSIIERLAKIAQIARIEKIWSEVQQLMCEICLELSCLLLSARLARLKVAAGSLPAVQL